MLLKAYFIAAWVAVTVIGSALPPVKTARSDVVEKAKDNLRMAFAIPITDKPIHLQLLTATPEKRKAAFDCQVHICKTKNREDCSLVNANSNTCYNLVSSDGRPFVSSGGFKTGLLNFGCYCEVYKTKKCVVPTTINISDKTKKPIEVKRKKVSVVLTPFRNAGEFPFKAKSIWCWNWGDPMPL
jgi:hypothetical protein